MSPMRALRADSVLVAVIIGGFVLLMALIADGIVSGDMQSVVGLAGIVATIVTGSISALVVLAVKETDKKSDR